MGANDALTLAVSKLLGPLNTDSDDIILEPCSAGGNNRVFVVRAGERTYIAKWYFSHPSDPRDRLHAEFGFLRYAREIGLQCVPLAVASEPGKQLGLYEFIAGQKLTGDQISAREVDAAGDFIAALNDGPARIHAHALPPASEACFSVAQHFETVDARIGRLQSLDGESDEDRMARTLVHRIDAVWQRVRQGIVQALPLGEIVDAHTRLISPSDFGFHNALRRPNGDLCFIDFEYAGWDDPAKTIGDFFSQPTVPVSLDHFDRFVDRVTRHTPHRAAVNARARSLLPLFRLKWCCIMLNDFLPVARARRRFADPERDDGAAQRRQLARAGDALDRIEASLT